MYVRDKYEKEPFRMLFLGLLYGVYSTLVIWCLGDFINTLVPFSREDLFRAFVGSAGVEETVKFLFLFFLVWRNPNFNEPFDGIVYAVFVALGFALVENILYVLDPEVGGLRTAISRAVFSVPGHALFGVEMGYYFAAAKFENKRPFLWMALAVPWFLHGVYNFILYQENRWLWVPFVGFVLFLWLLGLKRMKRLLERSPFK